MDVKKIVNCLIDDIIGGTAISQILLKAQIVAYNIDDEMFSKLIKNEQQGYSSNAETPGYRQLKTKVNATFVDPLGNERTVEVHSETIEDEKIRNLMSYVCVKEPLVQIENIYKNAKSEMLKVLVPVFAYPIIKKLYAYNCLKVRSAHHYFSKESLLSIVEIFKAQLLELLLQFDKNLDWNIDLSTEQNREKVKTIINNVYHVKAVVANMGDGNVETNDIQLK